MRRVKKTSLTPAQAMATSDNVVRAGLTPKLRDTAVLCSSLTYAQVGSNGQRLKS